jgi:pimeloyl-ACP methyl ester carboxylesterase
VTYDRRANSRSPRPAGYAATSVQQHADDAAGLVEALGLAPAAVFGSSAGAATLLEVVVRRPDVLRGALVHEPPLLGVLPNAAEVGAQLQAMVEEGFARGGPRAAIELFARTVQGDATYEAIDPAVRERLLGNAEVFFTVEMQPFVAYALNVDALLAANVPVIPLTGVENRETWMYGTTRWLADRVGAAIVDLPGRHAGFADHPKAVAGILRPILERLS